MRILNDFGAENVVINNYKPLPNFKLYGLNSLDRSQEAFFGRSSPLSMVLLKYTKELKSLVGDPNKKYNFKDKKFVSQIKELCDEFGAKIASEINAEKCWINIIPEKEANAFCLPLITCFDNRPVDKDGNPIDNKVSLEKYIDLENIIITKTGYKYKKSSNKLLLISFSLGMLWISNPEELCGIICHEIGHCFQQGIFGSYKNYSDLLYQQEIKNINKRTDEWITETHKGPFWKLMYLLFPLPGFFKYFSSIITFFFKPSFLQNNVFVKLNLFFHGKLHGRIKDKRFMIEDKVKQIDNGTISSKDMNKIQMNSFANDYDRQEEIDKEIKDNYDYYKKVDLYKKDEKLSKWTSFKKEIWKFFNVLAFDINNHQDNFFSFISLSRFARKNQAQEVFYRKYEYFADIFASSYGFGPSLYNNLLKFDDDYEKSIESKVFAKGIYKIPAIKAFALHEAYIRSRDIATTDEHGESYERSSAMYTYLINELKTNSDLTPTQKKAIEEDCNMYHKIDEDYYNRNKKDGLLYKWYNKMLEKKVTTKSEKVEDLILGPILEVELESQKK